MITSRSARNRTHGRIVSLAIIAACAAGCAAPSPSDQAATRGDGPTDDVQQVVAAHRSLIQSFEAGDVDAFMGLLDGSGDVLIFHPRVESWFDNRNQMRKGLTAMFARLGHSEVTEAHNRIIVRGDAAWHTALIAVEAANLEEPFLGRSTEIWARGPAGWRLAHAHWSEHPGSDRSGQDGW